MKKAITILTNVSFGNFILWFFETTGRKQDHLDSRLIFGFSSAAIILLLIAFRFIRPKQSLLRSTELAGGVSFLVPILGLTLSFFAPSSLNATLLGIMLAVTMGPMLWEWALPMFLLNVFLFHQISRE